MKHKWPLLTTNPLTARVWLMGTGSNWVKKGLNVKLYCPYGHHLSALAIGVTARPAVLLYPTSGQNRTATAARKEEKHMEMVSTSEGNPVGVRNSEKSNHRPLWQLKQNFIGK